MPDPTATSAVCHDVQALHVAQRAAQEAVQPLILEMAQLHMLYTTTRWLCRRDALSGDTIVEQVETVWTNADAEALYQQYAAMVRQMLENPPPAHA